MISCILKGGPEETETALPLETLSLRSSPPRGGRLLPASLMAFDTSIVLYTASAFCRTHHRLRVLLSLCLPQPVLSPTSPTYVTFFLSSIEKPPGPWFTSNSSPPTMLNVWKKSYLKKSLAG